MIKYIKGNILDDNLKSNINIDVIVHGCNCFCTFGKGLAKQIKYKYPESYIADCNTIKGDRNKLGSCTYHDYGYGDVIIVNAYIQYYYGTNKRNVDYKAIRKCMKWIKNTYSGKKIALPKIGTGLAGGNWDIIEKIIIEELNDEDITIVVLDK